MPRPVAHLLLALTLGPMALSGQAFPRPSSSDSAAIMDGMARSVEAWARGDVPAFVAVYADSATFMTKQGPVPGKDRMERMYAAQYFVDGKPKQSLTYSDMVLRALGRDHVLMTGACHLTGGNLPDFNCRYSLVWERTKAGWRIIHDHSS